MASDSSASYGVTALYPSYWSCVTQGRSVNGAINLAFETRATDWRARFGFCAVGDRLSDSLVPTKGGV
jgi:hypothetical protein